MILSQTPSSTPGGYLREAIHRDHRRDSIDDVLDEAYEWLEANVSRCADMRQIFALAVELISSHSLGSPLNLRFQETCKQLSKKESKQDREKRK